MIGQIHSLTHVFARLEMRHFFRRYAHLVTGFGVAPNAFRTLIHRETAKAADLAIDPALLAETAAILEGVRIS